MMCVLIQRWYQIAQKIHACTELYPDGRENERFRDLNDLQLLRELVDDGGLPAVRAACVEIFELRAKHAWPPAVTIWPSWADGFTAMAREVAFNTDDVGIAANDLRVSSPISTPPELPTDRGGHRRARAASSRSDAASRRTSAGELAASSRDAVAFSSSARSATVS